MPPSPNGQPQELWPFLACSLVPSCPPPAQTDRYMLPTRLAVARGGTGQSGAVRGSPGQSGAVRG
eukprot:13573196-Alexandrium_andersonii.AAC.1